MIHDDFVCLHNGLYRIKTQKRFGSKIRGVIQGSYNRTRYREHMLVWYYHYLYFPTKIIHLDGNQLNNSITNLLDIDILTQMPIEQRVRICFTYDDGLYWKVKLANNKVGDRFGFITPKKYRYGQFFGKRYPEHHLVWAYHNKQLPPHNMMVDHINRARHDNRIENLRLCSNSENQANRISTVGSTSKYKGVTRKGNKWIAAIQNDKQRYYLGSFDDEQQAALAYNEKAVELFGEYARLNDL